MAGKASPRLPGARRALASSLFLIVAAGGLGGCAEGGPFEFLKSGLTAHAVSPSGNATTANGETRLAYQTIEPGGGRAMVGEPYRINGRWYYPEEDPDYTAVGMASWYGSDFHGLETANGETFNMAALTAAHPTMPLPSYARVTNLENGRSIVVRVNDRGPFAHGRLIDLSRRAAGMLGYENQGVAEVRVDYIGRAPLEGDDEPMLLASFQESGGAAPLPFPADPGLPAGTMIAAATPPPAPAALPAPAPMVVAAAYAPSEAAPAVPSPAIRPPAAVPSATPVMAVVPSAPPPVMIAPAAFSAYFDPIGATIAGNTSLYAADERAFVNAAAAHGAIEAMAMGGSLALGASAP
ncbi:MAG: septal ring lytic transglycosylase RlpA family protein [Bauldia sp.]|nr:septal ring lytic transglycosylase RlpA family protein [Bauldia sp.]